MRAFLSGIAPKFFRKEEKTAVLFRAVLEKVDHDAAYPAYIRIKAGGRVFFALADSFADPSVLASLEEGQDLFVGARELEDGCFWLHWLRTADGAELVPVDDAELYARKCGRVRLGATIAGAGVCFLFILFLASFVSSFRHAIVPSMFGMACLALIVAGLVVRCRNEGFVRAMRGESRRILDDGLERIRQNDNRLFRLPPTPPASAGAASGRIEDDGVATAAGAVSRVRTNARHGPNFFEHQTDGPLYLMYNFTCDGKQVSFPAQPLPELVTGTTPPLAVRRRFLFLAEGDRVTAIMNAHETLVRRVTKITPATDHAEAAALVNHEDGHAAVSLAVSLARPRQIYAAIGAACGITWALMASVWFFMVLAGEGEGMAGALVLMTLALAVFWAAGCLLWEFGRNGCLLLSGEETDRRRWEARAGELLARLAPGKIPAMSRQTWRDAATRVALLLAAGGATAFLVHAWIGFLEN